jgi:hypothetical protein
MSDLVDERAQRSVALLDGDDLPRGEEALAQEADGALDAPLLPGLPRRAQPQLHAVVARQLDEQRMEACGIPERSRTTLLGLS